jgi:putative DNA primase/helicase
MTASAFADTLRARRVSAVRWMAKCPAHPDRNPSLSIAEGENGHILLRCHAGCTVEAILHALTLTVADICGPQWSGGSKGEEFVAAYDYHDPSGKLVYQAVRYSSPKKFRQRRPDGRGGFTWNMDGISRVLFNIPMLVRSNVALIAEGEKDALNLQEAAVRFRDDEAKLTYAATTNIGGAGKWLETYSPYLAGKSVFVFQDNDDAGRAHAQQVCASVQKYAQVVRLVELPGLPEKGDVSDYLNSHNVDELFALMQASQVWSDSSASTISRATAEATGETLNAIGLKLKCGTDIVEREQSWLVPFFVPGDTLIVVAGQVGLGKTTACLSLGASITNGQTPIIGGKCEPRNVLMLSNEDSEAQIRRIFMRLGGNLSRLYVEDEDSDRPWGLGNIPALEVHIAGLKPALVIIDSLTTHKPSKCDLNAHGDVAPMLVALRKLAAKFDCAIICIHHTNKSQTSDPLAKIGGSIGISATARHVILVGPHSEDANARVAVIVKSNLVKQDAPGYIFRLDPFTWEGTTQLKGHDLLQQAGANVSGISDAEIFLRDVLTEGREDSAALAHRAESGYGIKRRTLQRAADALSVVRQSIGFGPGRKVYWSLPSAIGDTTSATNREGVVDGPAPIDSALSNAPPTIDDTFRETVADVSPVVAEEMFEAEV